MLFAILCFAGGLFLGLAVVLGTGGGRGSVGVGLLVGAVIGAGLAYISKYIYKALVFLVNAGVVVLLFILFSSDATMGVMSMLGLALGTVAGFFAVKYIRFSLILSTSLFYGLTAGTSILLVAGVVNPGLGILLGAVLVAFGFHYQWKTTGGGSFKDYFLLRKTEAEQEKQAARVTVKPHVTVHSGIVATKGAAVPADLLGVSFFSRAGVYGVIPFAVALVLPLLPLGTVTQVLVISLAVAVSVYLSPCAGVGMIVCSRLIPLFRILPLVSRGYPLALFMGSFAASLIFVALVSAGCRRFPGLMKHVLIFAGAGILSEFLLLFVNLEHVSNGNDMLYHILLPFLLSGLCAAAVVEFAVPPIINRLPLNIRALFQTGEATAEETTATSAVGVGATETEDVQ